jgi:hypothetical protein
MERQQQITQELRALQAELTKLRAAAPGQGQRQAAAVQAGTNGAGVPVPPPRTAPAGDPGAAASASAGKPTPPPAQAAAAPGQTGGAAPAGLNGEDVHAWLCQRMADLQQERQSRWRRLLNFLAGKPSEGHVP